MITILQKEPFSKYRLSSAGNLNEGSRTFWQLLNPVPCLSAAHWCCSALLKPVWHDAPWQDTIFSIPQCVTPSRARFDPGKPPPLNALWGNCEALRDLTVQRKISRAHIYTHTPVGMMTRDGKHTFNAFNDSPACSCSHLQLIIFFDMLCWICKRRAKKI